MRSALTFVHGRAVYLWVIFAMPAASIFGHALAPGKPFFKAQDLGILAALAMTAIAALAWLPFRRRRPWPPRVFGLFAVILIAWLYQLVRTQFDQSVFNLTAFAIPVILVLIAAKSVSRSDVNIALLVLGYTLIGISLASLFFGKFGWMPDGFEVSDAGDARFTILQWVGIPKRWGGPFQSVNYASPIGGLLIVLGATQTRWHRWLLVAGGLLILALGQGRTAIFAVAAGLLIVILWSPAVSHLRQVRLVRWVAGLSALLIGIGYVALLDPTFNGRTPIWSNFLGLLPQNPLFGVGDSGMLSFVAEMARDPSFVPHTHAHSVLLDGLVRYGLLMAVLALAIYALCLAAGVRSLRLGDPAPMALTVFVITAGLAETVHSWNYWSVYTAVLTWVVLRSAATEDPDPSRRDVEANSLSLPSG